MRLPFVLPPARPADITDRLVDYLVDTPDGPVGVLDGFERDESGRPATLIVSQGWFGRRRLLVPLEELAEVDHAGKRIILAPGAAPIEQRGPFGRLIDLGGSDCKQDDSEEAFDDLGWRRVERGQVLCEVVDEEYPSAEVNVAAELATADDLSLCPVCGRATRTTTRGACSDCWQRKLPEGEAVFRPRERPSPLLLESVGAPTWVVVVAVVAILAGLLTAIGLTL